MDMCIGWAVSRGVHLLTAIGMTADILFTPRALPIQQMVCAVAQDVWAWPHADRIFDVALVCGGEAGIKFAAEMRGLRAASFDVCDNPCMNLLSLGGLIMLVDMSRRVKRGGTVWMSPECRTWLSYLSRNTYQRDAGDNILGTARTDTINESLNDANATVIVTTWLMTFCGCQYVYVAIEQPLRSLMFKHPVMKLTLWMLDASRTTPALGAFGGSSAKPLE
eukprot:9479387-Pyramimonas_sp.AAC.1